MDKDKPSKNPKGRKRQLREKYKKFDAQNEELYKEAYAQEIKSEGGLYQSDDPKLPDVTTSSQGKQGTLIRQQKLAYQEEQDVQMTFVEHLEELRVRFIRILIIAGIFTVAAIALSEYLVFFLQEPYTRFGHKLVTTNPTGAFLTRLKISLMIAFVGAMPFILHQIWLFIFPALSGKFRRIGVSLLLFAYLLFLTGVSFNFFIVLPYVLESLISMAWQGVEILYDIHDYYDFILIMSLLFGFIFEMPIFVLIFVRIGLLNHRFLIKQWRYSLVIGSIIAALLTPPDAVSQIMMLVPMIILYVISIGIAYLFRRNEDEA